LVEIGSVSIEDDVPSEKLADVNHAIRDAYLVKEQFLRCVGKLPEAQLGEFKAHLDYLESQER
jgi:hypothetical protein